MHIRLAVPLLCCALAVAPSSLRVPDATSNPNTASAGLLRNGVLSVTLVAQMAVWHPLADNGPAAHVEAFGEEGRAPMVPGPLLRAPVGTRFDLRIRNTFADTLLVAAACTYPCASADTVRVAPGATGRLAITPRAAGTFTYWGSLIRRGEGAPDGGQLAGVLVVDSSSRVVPDRILVITNFDAPPPDSTRPRAPFNLLFAINGKAWPHTERLTYTVGDSIRWRVVHLGPGEHPMHLHGFYFRVASRSDGVTEHALAPTTQPLVVTEEVGTLGSIQMAWSPDRAGNWLFHCHKPLHTAVSAQFGLNTARGKEQPHDEANHAMTGMGGLVIGVTVRPKASAQQAGDTSAPTKRMRLLVHKREHYYGTEPAYGFVLQEGDKAPARDSVLVPGPLLTLTRGERTAITVVNESDSATAVHWHGIELQSYFDGVAGWSGAGNSLAPRIAPRDSFTAVFTPPRAGTFIYHTHVNDIAQLAAGMYGGLVVLDPGQKWNDTTDHLFTIGQAGLFDPAWTVVNGFPTWDTQRWRKGVTHRLRFLSVTLDQESDIVIENDKGVATWTPVARDGAPVPVSEMKPQPARLHFGPGQTFDFEFRPEPGEYRMRISAVTHVLMVFRVR